MPTDPKEAVNLIQNYPVGFTVSFSKLQKGIEAVALEFYLPVGRPFIWRMEGGYSVF